MRTGTKEFADAVVRSLGKHPRTLPAVNYKNKGFSSTGNLPVFSSPPGDRRLVGVDVYIYAKVSASTFLERIRGCAPPISLHSVSNRGVRIWPEGHQETFCIEQWRCRFLCKGKTFTQNEVISLLSFLSDRGFDVIGTYHLYRFDAAPGYSSSEE